VASKIEARCGWVRVPVDWTHPLGPQRPLAVVVVPGKASSRGAPLFYLSGYGGSAIGDIAWATNVFQTVNFTHDLVFVDQRGTGHSDSHTCPGVPATGSFIDTASVRAWVHRCLAGAKYDPRHDTTTSAIRDLDRVRTALGYGKISLYGGSYGVTMGLAYLQRYGDHVASAVLDSGSLLNVRLWQESPTSAQQAFDRVAQRCEVDPACATNLPTGGRLEDRRRKPAGPPD
jgi:pimeloyl-ACP methyl ester carboxylesterase